MGSIEVCRHHVPFFCISKFLRPEEFASWVCVARGPQPSDDLENYRSLCARELGIEPSAFAAVAKLGSSTFWRHCVRLSRSARRPVKVTGPSFAEIELFQNALRRMRVDPFEDSDDLDSNSGSEVALDHFQADPSEDHNFRLRFDPYEDRMLQNMRQRSRLGLQ